MNTTTNDDVVDEVLMLQARFKAKGGSMMPLLEKHGERDNHGQLIVQDEAVEELRQELKTLLGDCIVKSP